MSVDARWDWMRVELDRLHQQSQLRGLASSLSLEDGFILKDGARLFNLSSNHYLGLELRLDEALLQHLSQQSDACGSHLQLGSTASRLVVGNDPIYASFEQEFAHFKGTEACLLFGSGYTANIGIISAMAGRDDAVFSDRLNHASIVDGITLSRADHYRYRHRDMDHLETLLKKAKPGQKKLIVTDTIFSMDGSIAPLRDLVRLRDQYEAILMVDEAHSGGVFGVQGQGLVHALGLTDSADIQMGTFSKAYGSYGAYVAGNRLLIDYLINKARSFIYTTALPSMVIQATRYQWLRAKEESWRRDQLMDKSRRFRERLKASGWNIGDSECQIIPVIVEDNEKALALSRYLHHHGVAAVAIRPPTIPEGTSRIRFSLIATHQDEQLEQALDVLDRARKELSLR